MNYTAIKAIKDFCANTIDADDWREVVENADATEADFEVNDYRFIHTDEIDQIQQDELSGDEYVLGCFNASFLAGVLGIDQDVIDAMQNSEAFEAVGKLVLSMDKLEDVQSEYASADGYGHHFNHYDGNEYELDTPNGMYHVFQIN